MASFLLLEYHFSHNSKTDKLMAKALTTEEFIESAKEIHGDRYFYGESVYANYLKPLTIICKDHGRFDQKPNNHLNGAGCPSCAKAVVAKKLSSDKGEFVLKAQKKFGDAYTYQRVEYVNAKTPVIVTCKEHGDFSVTPNAFISGHTTCSSCSGSKLSTASFVARAKQVHADRYDYSNSRVAGYHGVVKIHCNEHGDFEQTPNNHLKGKGCPRCAGRMVSDTESFIKRALETHKTLYSYESAEYVSALKKVRVTCKKHGEFSQLPGNHLSGDGCPKCVAKISKAEIELFDFVKSLSPSAHQSDRKIIPPFELDVVATDKRVAIEFNGLYFHSDRNEGRRDTYHYDKMTAAKEAGYRLIQVWEDDWRDRRPVVEKTLTHIFQSSAVKIHARQCKVTKPSLRGVAKFFEENHLQGCPRRGEVYALERDGVVVAAMAFHAVASERGKVASEHRWELGRFASTCSVVGGASRLFSAFVKNTPQCSEVISYSDNDWFDGGMYRALGFSHVSDSPPDYKVVDGGVRRHKINFKLSELKKRFGSEFDPLLSERENCRKNGLFRVYNSGLKKWEWKR